MADIHALLADLYQAIDLNRPSEDLRARLFGKVQMEGWLGRRVLELGCGTGETACWFAQNGFRITAFDQSEAMLSAAQRRSEEMGVVVNWQYGDIRQLPDDPGYDLVLAMDTLNEMRSIRDLETVLRGAFAALAPGKLLLFDLRTIEGLATQWGTRDIVLHDDPESLLLVVRSHFSYENATNARHMILYRRGENGWQRDEAELVLRAYALQAVGTLLKRIGFQVQSVLNPYFEPFNPASDETGHAIFIAARPE